jgi:[acyl-carrier-protein] S-malonyltransferase
MRASSVTRAFVFPGQGSQQVGMGKDLAEAFAVARDVFAEADDALGQHLFKLMTEGPESDLNLTENTQPAILAHSLAVVRVLEEAGVKLKEKGALVAGHSLGELSALTAAGVFSLSDAVRLVKRRGQAMQRAVPVGIGAMAALLGVDFEAALAIAEEAAQGEVCTAANDNAPGQVVVSGHKGAVERAVKIAADKGAKRAVILPVSAPFHCPLMQPAADEMQAALEEMTLNHPSPPLIANVTAAQTGDPSEIKRLLVEQITGTVRWRTSVLAMKESGVDTLVEIGIGKVLTGLTKRIDKDLQGQAVGTPEDIEAFVKAV